LPQAAGRRPANKQYAARDLSNLDGQQLHLIAQRHDSDDRNLPAAR